MSKSPNRRIRKYWEKVGGLLIEDYQIKPKKKNTTRRVIDAIIVLGEEHRIWTEGSYNFTGKDIIIVQLKKEHQGMQFLGRAFSSRENMMLHQPRTLRTVAICHKHDAEMYRLCQEFAIEMEVISEAEM